MGLLLGAVLHRIGHMLPALQNTARRPPQGGRCWRRKAVRGLRSQRHHGYVCPMRFWLVRTVACCILPPAQQLQRIMRGTVHSTVSTLPSHIVLLWCNQCGPHEHHPEYKLRGSFRHVAHTDCTLSFHHGMNEHVLIQVTPPCMHAPRRLWETHPHVGQQRDMPIHGCCDPEPGIGTSDAHKFHQVTPYRRLHHCPVCPPVQACTDATPVLGFVAGGDKESGCQLRPDKQLPRHDVWARCGCGAKPRYGHLPHPTIFLCPYANSCAGVGACVSRENRSECVAECVVGLVV